MYYNPTTKEILSHRDLKNRLNASIPQDKEQVNGWFLIHIDEYPEIPDGKKVVDGEIKLVENHYVQTHVLVDMTEEELEQQKKDKLQQAKFERDEKVEKLTVTVDNMEFDANERSQERISRVILANNNDDTKSIEWILANNTVASVTVAQLKNVLLLATEALSKIWVSVYDEVTTA